MNQPFQLNDKIRIITCPPALGDLDGEIGFITEIHPVHPNHTFPTATIFLGSEQSITLNTVFLQLLRRYSVPIAKPKGSVQVPASKLSGWTPERRAKFQATMAARKAGTHQPKTSEEDAILSGAVPELISVPAPAPVVVPIPNPPAMVGVSRLSDRSTASLTGVPTCARCGHSSPLMMGVNRCQEVDTGGKRCGGVMTR